MCATLLAPKFIASPVPHGPPWFLATSFPSRSAMPPPPPYALSSYCVPSRVFHDCTPTTLQTLSRLPVRVLLSRSRPFSSPLLPPHSAHDPLCLPRSLVGIIPRLGNYRWTGATPPRSSTIVPSLRNYVKLYVIPRK